MTGFDPTTLIDPNYMQCHLCEALNYCVTRLGRGCGAVGRAVASIARDSWFESSHSLTTFSLELYHFSEMCQ